MTNNTNKNKLKKYYFGLFNKKKGQSTVRGNK